MSELKNNRLREGIIHAAAEFISKESNRTSLITVTGADLSPKGDKARILITVFPEDQEEVALDFVKRQAGELREFLSKRLSLRELPWLSFEIDIGEKNRQRIDKLSQSS